MFDLKSFRKGVDEFSSETSLEYYLNWAGLKEDLNLSNIFNKYANLFDRQNVTIIKKMRTKERKGGEIERRLRYLQAFATEESLGHSVKEYTDEFETVASKEIIKIDGEQIPFRLAEVKVLNEDDRKKRSMLFRARNTIIDDKLTPILKRRVEKLHSIAHEFGYRDYVWLFRDTKNINFQELSDSMTYFVERTESLYVDKMDEAMQKVIGVHLREAEKHDAAHVFRAKEYDSYFRKENASPVLENTLRGIGYSIKKYRNILIDVEERPRKLPRAFTSVIKVPGDVRLVVMPKGGQDDYTSMLHEAGHTMHYALVDPKSPVEYKRLGDASVTETYAFLLEYLTLNKTWLKENVGITEFDKYLDFAYLYKLYFLRRYAAKLKYELILHQGNEVDNMSEVYREKMEESLKFQHPEAHYLTDTDDGFYTSQYLRAWIFESQLRAYLVEKVGEAWFKSLKTGRILGGLWSKGQKYDVVELAQRIGYKGLDVKPLLSEIQEHFA
ncbi:MAG: hypothetical protein WED05_07000 [Candidatus Atabeyarchaeum deiterrae]